MKLIIALTGASGQIYGIRILEILKDLNVETHLIISPLAEANIKIETDYSVDDVIGLADYVYRYDEMDAAIASGSFKHNGMIIVPCTIKTASSIAYGIADNLIVRSADVTLKERRKLLLAIRETPLHLGHLSTLKKLAEIGAIIFPLIPMFYTKPKSVKDLIDHTIGRILDLFDIEHDLYIPWGREKLK